jgi:hypothetical protein
MGSIFRKGSEQTGQSQAMSHEMADLARRQAGMAEGLFGDTKATRDRFIGIGTELMRGDGLPSFLKSTVGLGVPIMQQEQELSAAKRGILDTMPRGGLQQRALMELPIQRLLQRDIFSAQRNALDDATRQNLFGNVMSFATGTPQTALGGMSQAGSMVGNAAGNLNSLGQQRMNQNFQAQQGIGKLAGTAAQLGTKGMTGGMGGAGSFRSPVPWLPSH